MKSTFSRLALAGTLALTGAMTTAGLAGAQESSASASECESGDPMEFEATGLTSNLTDYEIALSGDSFEVTNACEGEWNDSSGEPGDFELINFESSAAFGEIDFFDDTDTPEQTIETWSSSIADDTDYDNFEVADSGEDNGVFWQVATFEYDGTPFIYYMQVTEDVEGNVDQFENLLSPEDTFVDEFDAAQEEIEIDGNSIFDGQDGQDIADIAGGGSSTSDDADADSTPEGNVSETNSVAQTSDDSTADASTDGSYTFENADIEVELEDPYTFTGEPMVQQGIEQIMFTGDASIGAVTAVPLDTTEADDAQGVLDVFLEGFGGEMDSFEEIDSGNDGDVTWAFYQAETNGETMLVYAQVDEGADDDNYVLQLFAGTEAEFEDEFGTVQDSVKVNGDDFMDGVDAGDLLDMM